MSETASYEEAVKLIRKRAFERAFAVGPVKPGARESLESIVSFCAFVYGRDFNGVLDDVMGGDE